MEMGEVIAVSGMQKEIDESCPFCEDVKGASENETEHIADDDKNKVQQVQANNGGTLGDNLNEGSNGKSGTWQGAPYEPTTAQKSPANDSRRRNGQSVVQDWQMVRVPGATNIAPGSYPFTVAAHHLIPGNASLYQAKNRLQNYLLQGKAVKAGGKSWTIKYHIGYNVNGAHNGVWSPGNYAIRAHASPTGKSWGKMINQDWQLNYVAACVKATGRQFHDAHTQYNTAVLKLMNKIAEKLEFHQAHCKKCEAKSGGKIPPPYLIKQRLYNLSNYFKQNLCASPSSWRRPWFTSDRWRDVVFKNNAETPCSEFMDAYNQASIEEVQEK
jgi:A nuclease family of the HNH/ENDO VII superfamily with conserved AHH